MTRVLLFDIDLTITVVVTENECKVDGADKDTKTSNRAKQNRTISKELPERLVG